jgi:hypothetical protein
MEWAREAETEMEAMNYKRESSAWLPRKAVGFDFSN